MGFTCGKCDISIGNSKAYISLTANSQTNLIACEIYIPDSKDLFYELETNKNKIEEELQAELEWMALDGKKASRIKLSNDADINQKENWDQYFDWLMITAENFQSVFGQHINKLLK